MRRSFRSPSLADLRRALRRRRRMLALLAVIAAITSVLPSLAPAEARTVRVVVAAHDLRDGALLDADAVTTVAVAVPLVPHGALSDPNEAVGRRLATAVPRGGAIVTAALTDRDDPVLEPGRGVVAVAVDTLIVPQLTPGRSVTLIVSTPDPGATRTVRGIIVTTDETAGQRDTAPAGGAPSESRALVSVDAGDAAAIAYATREGWVVVVPVR